MQFLTLTLFLALWAPNFFVGTSAAFIPEFAAPSILDNFDNVGRRLLRYLFDSKGKEILDSEPAYQFEDSDQAHYSAPTTDAVPKLFPIPKVVKSWTTSTSRPSSGPCTNLTLSNTLFRLKNDIAAHPHPIVNAPDGAKSMRATYAKGVYTYSHGSPAGFSFYAPGPVGVDLTTAKEATFGYSVYFPANFNFVKGGKLPGIYGGDSESEAIGCSGGRRDTGCFSVRFMWRTNGAGELYTYLPDWPANEKLCTVKPYSECNPTYGASVGRGSFKFAKGTWTTITQRVKLNDLTKDNGELQLFANGNSVVNVTGLKIRGTDGKGKMRGMQMQTFFGGSTADWAATKQEQVYFKDFTMAITRVF